MVSLLVVLVFNGWFRFLIKIIFCSTLMRSQPNTHFVVDIDPYGTPVPFLDAAINVMVSNLFEY